MIVTDGTEKSMGFLAALQQIITKYSDAGLIERNDNEYNLKLVRQLNDDDAFTIDEATEAKNQIKTLLEDIEDLVVNFSNRETPI